MSVYRVKGAVSLNAKKTLHKEAIRVVSIDLRKDAGRSGQVILRGEDDEILVALDVEKKEFEQGSLF
jgi:hypothetical protein